MGPGEDIVRLVLADYNIYEKSSKEIAMKQRELLEQEGLFLLDFDNDFFDQIFKDNHGLKEEVSEIVEKVKKHPGFKAGNIWHCIFDTVIKKNCPDGIDEVLGIGKNRIIEEKYQELYRLLSGFYADPFFLSLDVAQEIQYNLLRLETSDEIDLNGSEKTLKWYEEWIDIGNKKYGDEKKLIDDFEEDMDRLNKKYGSDNTLSVKMFCQIENHKIPIDTEFVELNLAYMGNEKFRDYLNHKGKQGTYLETLMDLIEKLDKGEVPMQYIWEKLTNFNTICILGKFLFHINGSRNKRNITEKEQMEFLETFTEEPTHPFFPIWDMPNYLTRLLCLKQILGYIEKQNPYRISDLWRQFNIFLSEINTKYKRLQNCILGWSILVKWKLDEKKNQSKEEWIESLDKEYSIFLYEKLYISSDIPFECYASKNMDALQGEIPSYRQEKYRLMMNGICGKRKPINHLNDNEKIELLMELKKKMDYMEAMEKEGHRYLTGSEKWGKWLEEAGYIPVDKVLWDKLNQDNDEGYIKTPIGDIYQANANNNSANGTEKKYGNMIDKRLDEVIKPHLLSEYQYIIFENSTGIRNNKILKKYINYLLYHFYI